MSYDQGASTTPDDDADPFLLEPAEIASLMPTLAYKATAASLESASSFAGFAGNPHLDAFYAWFFPCHPFVLPRTSLLAQDGSALSVLVPVMELVGSHYAEAATTEDKKLLLLQSMAAPLTEDGFTVQALLLLALTLEWSGESDKAEQTLSRTKAMALSIGMNQHEFSVNNAIDDPVLAESWRRTWWELFVVDCLFAGIRHYPTFELYNAEYNAQLPCEEADYTSLNIPLPRSLEEYDNREFDDTETPFSSFTYVIAAARMHGTCLAAGDVAGKSPIELVKITEANILSWHLHLPKRKRDVVCDDGSVDEVLFRAHMIIQTVATHLHRPRSALHYSTMELLCSKYAPPLPGETIPPRDRQPDKHTHKAIQAARAFVDILAVPSPPIAHSPFVMCMGSMAIATHLSACEYLLQGSEYAHAKDRVRVFLGLLKAFDGIWPTSAKWSGEIKMMAKAVFDGRNIQGQPLASTGTASMTNDDTNMLLDDTYILDL